MIKTTQDFADSVHHFEGHGMQAYGVIDGRTVRLCFAEPGEVETGRSATFCFKRHGHLDEHYYAR